MFGEGEPYIQKRRIRSGLQTVTLMAPHKPTRAGIAPENLLIETDPEDNIRDVNREK